MEVRALVSIPFRSGAAWKLGDFPLSGAEIKSGARIRLPQKTGQLRIRSQTTSGSETIPSQRVEAHP